MSGDSMMLFLIGVVFGALAPIALAVAEVFWKRRARRRREREYLRRSIPTLADR